jgi:hypothetical protein
MATADDYAGWIVKNEAKKGTEEFNTVVSAYKEALKEEMQTGTEQSVMPGVTPEKSIMGVAKQSAIKGLSGLGDLIIGAPENYKNLVNYIATPNAKLPQIAEPVTGYLREQKIITPQNEPNTPALKVLDFTTQLATGGGGSPYAMGKSLLTKSLPQAGKEIAGQFGRLGTQGLVGSSALQGMEAVGIDNPLVKAVGTAVPMGITGAATSLRSTPSSIVNTALKGTTPEQMKLADMLLKQSYEKGSPLTGSEAIAQVTNANPMTNIQRVIENSPKGAPIVAPFMAERPARNVSMVENELSNISPNQGNLETPMRMQATAQKAIDEARTAGNNVAKPFYDSSRNQIIDNSTFVSMMSDPKVEQAVKRVLADPNYGVTNARPNSIEVFDAAKKLLNDEYDTFKREGKSNAARLTSEAAQRITSNLDVISPNYQQARGIVANNMANVVEPMQNLPLGKIANTEGFGENIASTQRSTLMPNAPKALTPVEIRKTVDLLNKQDPTISQDWTRQNLQSIFNETNQDLRTGANQFGGANFAATITGNKAQRENLKALVEESTSPSTWKGFETVLDVLNAQGKRQAAGSQTSFNEMFKAGLGEGGAFTLAKALVKPSGLANAYEQFRMGSNSQTLARLLTDPDSVKLLQDLAKTAPTSAKAQVLTNTLAGSIVGAKPEGSSIEFPPGYTP